MRSTADHLIPIAQDESHLPRPRLTGELTRTTFQIRLLADAAAAGEHCFRSYRSRRPTVADGRSAAGSAPHVGPVGPVLVFGASNFPFAFSTAGGDTASALAAGCPVIYKATTATPALSDATATVVNDALDTAGAPAGLFSTIHSPDGRAVLAHPTSKAAAFTGGIPGEHFRHRTGTSQPIPFYGELGSVNPVFVTESAASARAQEIVDGFLGSFTLGQGSSAPNPESFWYPPIRRSRTCCAMPRCRPDMHCSTRE